MTKNTTDHELFDLRELFTFTYSYIYEILYGNMNHYELTQIMLFCSMTVDGLSPR